MVKDKIKIIFHKIKNFIDLLDKSKRGGGIMAIDHNTNDQKRLNNKRRIIMKKSLSKLPALIVFSILSLIMLITVLVYGIKPVNYGDKYKATVTTNKFSNDLEYVGDISFSLSFKEDDILSVGYDLHTYEDTYNGDYRIMRDGNQFIILGNANDVSLDEKNEIEEAFKNAEDKNQYYETYAYGRVTGYSLRIENEHLLRSAILESTSNDEDLDIYNTLNASSRTFPIWYFNTDFVVRIVALSIVFIIFVAFTISSITLFVIDKKKNKIA